MNALAPIKWSRTEVHDHGQDSTSSTFLAVRPAEGALQNRSAAAAGERDSYTPIYQTLAEHQVVEDWTFGNVMIALHTWVRRIDAEFKLNTIEIAIRIDELPRNQLSHFHYGHNGFGLRGEIALNSRYMFGEFRREAWEILGALLHEMLHIWQQCHGTSPPWHYHNDEYRALAERLGLIVDRGGHTSCRIDGDFMLLLARHGVKVPIAAESGFEDSAGTQSAAPRRAKANRPVSKSKLLKYSCGCTNVRCAVRHFRARCLNCGQLFALTDVVQQSLNLP